MPIQGWPASGSDDAGRAVLGALAGLSAGLLVGVLFWLLGLFAALSALVGAEGSSLGWALHLSLTTALGAGFGALVVRDRYAGDATTAALIGLWYGGSIWLVGEALWTVAGGPTLANLGLVSLIGWLLYGLALGWLTAVVGPRSLPLAASGSGV